LQPAVIKHWKGSGGIPETMQICTAEKLMDLDKLQNLLNTQKMYGHLKFYCLNKGRRMLSYIIRITDYPLSQKLVTQFTIPSDLFPFPS
jgi:hypothetical protein